MAMAMVLFVIFSVFFSNPTTCYGRRVHGVSFRATTTTKRLYVFGDSLFDAGNNQYYTPAEYIPANHHPYGMTFDSATGRHSDGLLVPDFIAQYANIYLPPPILASDTNGTYGYNFASAGSGCLNHPNVINLYQQLAEFENVSQKLNESLGPNGAKNVLENAVYMFSMGGNDYFSFATNYKNTTETERIAYVAMVVDKLIGGIKKIYGKGGRKFAFQDVGPLGCLPTMKYVFGVVYGCYEDASELAVLHNAALREVLKTLQASSDYSEIKYGVFDYYTQLRNRVLNPIDYGFTIGDVACCGIGGLVNGKNCGMTQYFLCSNPSSFVMFDGAHTTQTTNHQLAELMWLGDHSIIAPYNVQQLFEDDELVAMA